MQSDEDVQLLVSWYLDEPGDIDEVHKWLNLITSIVMLLILLSFLIYLLRLEPICNRQRFELTILLSMIYRYTVLMILHDTGVFFTSEETIEKFMIFSSWVADYFCHWVYASQYLKTCFLVPDLVNKAYLLLSKHLKVISSQYSQG